MRLPALIVVVCLASCAHESACATRTCGAATWRGAVIGDPMVALPMTAADLRGATELRPGARGLRLRFDLSAASREQAISRAVLSLRVDASAARGGLVVVRARSLLAPWRPGADDDTPRSEASAEVSLPAGLRGPVRLDVTSLLSEAARWGHHVGDLALSCDDEGVVVGGPWSSDEAPRLEVTLR